ncbi:MAG: hypothetical protein KAY59_08150 [Acidobacteria bacterium]|nr:hypothetical protein [Acidobacteriota bacterium]MBP8274389.1 hypothetical protein [Acidobacteriota bacterium]
MSNVRRLTLLIFAYTTVEGLVINMMYPNTLPFIFKDVVILIAYLALMTESRGSGGSLSKISGPMFVYIGVTCLFLGMPSPVSLLGELVALKQRLFYIPLFYLGYHFMRDERDFLQLMKVMAFSAIPASLFGVYLYFTGPSGLTALGANYSAVFNSTAGAQGISFWRVPGTFTSPGQYGMFLMANGLLFVGVLFGSFVEKRQRLLTIVSLIVLLGALMVSGSRTPLLLLMLCTVVMLTVTGRLSGLGVWAGGLYGVLTAGFMYFGGGVQDRVGSIASWEHVERFNDTYFGQLFLPLLLQSPMGFGLGRATIGARHFTDWSNIMLVESYFGVIVAETGFLGLASFAWAMATLVIVLLQCRKVMRHAPGNVLWYANVLLVLAIAALMPISTTIDAAPGNLYFWFFIGTALKLYDLEVDRRRGLTAMSQPMASAPQVLPAPHLGFR